MKLLRLLPILLLFTACSSVRVATDYDKEVDFSKYKTFAFYKPGIDKAKISDLDKKRILRAIEANLLEKGFTKSENPDILVSIFTKERERVDVYNDSFGYGWGWNPWWYGNYWGNTISKTTEGTLFIDLIDAKTKQLVWQGIGTSSLVTYGSVDQKIERINKIVSEILEKYPPDSNLR